MGAWLVLAMAGSEHVMTAMLGLCISRARQSFLRQLSLAINQAAVGRFSTGVLAGPIGDAPTRVVSFPSERYTCHCRVTSVLLLARPSQH